MSDEPTEYELGSIHIRHFINEAGHPIVGLETDGDLPVVTQLGMLELARDTILDATHYDDEDDD